jgi:hypothetical protein
MLRLLFLSVLMIATVATMPCWAAEMDLCVFNNHAKSIASVEYTYKDGKGAGNTSKGSGFLVSSEGHILTAAHVLRPIDQSEVVEEAVTVQLGSSSSEVPKIPAQIIKRDSDLDIALLKIPTHPDQPLMALPIGDSSAVHVGTLITGLGYPKGGDLSFIRTSAVISPNTIILGVAKPWWQTDLALNEGDSGGPLFGPLGTVIGIALASRSGATLITYVLPIQYAQSLLDLAAAKTMIAGPCADLPECEDPSHGLDKYAIDVPVGKWSDWRGGGYNRNAYCNDLLGELKFQYPKANFAKIRDDEHNRTINDLADPFHKVGHVEYQYYCEFQRQEQPVYRRAKGVECLK